MKEITINEYKKSIKDARNNFFDKPYDLVYKIYDDLGYFSKDKDYFIDNASDIIETVRTKAWDVYAPREKMFTTKMLNSLIDKDYIQNMDSLEAIDWFASTYPEHIYQLSLSNTQSRRSRAGKEFEAILEILLTGAKIQFESQGNIGTKVFEKKGLSKLVDVVIPNSVCFEIRKFDCVLISAKTTLRERWQEVPEEMGRTGAGTMYLATLDQNASSDCIDTLYESNIQLVTTKSIKEKCYKNKTNVITFEELLENSAHFSNKWATYQFNEEDKIAIDRSIENSKNKHKDQEFIINFLNTNLK